MELIELIPLTLKEARAVVQQLHRTHRPPKGGLWAVGLARTRDWHVVGCAIVGRPVARQLADEWTAEVTRVAVQEGVPNGASKLLAACWRAARALGYRRLVTYTLVSEPGTSLRAAGYQEVARVRGESWSRRERPRVDEEHSAQAKIRWQRAS